MAPNTIIPVYGFSNSFIVKGDRAIIVDTGILQQHKKILAALEANGISRDQVSLIVLTHGHGDHYGCLKPLTEALGAPVMCGWPDAEYVEKGDSAPVVPVDMKGHVMKLFTGAKADPCRVDAVVKEDLDLKAYGVDARVLTTPGHTKGSISVLVSDGGCMMGDLIASLVFKNSIGRSPFAEAPDSIGPSLKKIIDSGAKYFYPGHGNRWDAAAVSKKFAPIIK
jgi:glyoxylase-like metal-dependent hydrolase (beta-lactamase superfamily II)